MRISQETHDRLKIIAAFEHVPMRELVDNMLRGQLEAWFKKKGFTFTKRD